MLLKLLEWLDFIFAFSLQFDNFVSLECSLADTSIVFVGIAGSVRVGTVGLGLGSAANWCLLKCSGPLKSKSFPKCRSPQLLKLVASCRVACFT